MSTKSVSDDTDFDNKDMDGGLKKFGSETSLNTVSKIPKLAPPSSGMKRVASDSNISRPVTDSSTPHKSAPFKRIESFSSRYR